MGDFINFLFDRYDRSVVVGTIMERRRSKLHRHYYDPKRVGSYGGVAALRRVVPAERDVERWLSTQDAYTLHKPVRRHFKRRCVVVGGPNQQWQADLVDMSRLKAANDGTTFLLTVIDVFSETGVVHSAEEQVGGVAGGRLQTVAKRRQQQQTDYVANR